MTKNGTANLTRFVRDLADSQATDRDLLSRFLDQQDEHAFENLVRRHDRLVRSAIGKVMGNAPDAEDAYQATFLVLVRRARSIDWHAGLGPWLYGVAHRVAVKARAQRAKRARSDGEAKPSQPILPPDLSWQEACNLLHAELDRLPDQYRIPILLCYLEGKTREEAAAVLGVTSGAIKGRIKRGCDMLRNRLARRGVTLSVGLLAILAAPSVIAASVISPSAVVAAVRGAAQPFVTALAQEVVMASVFSKLSKVLPIGILTLGVMSVALVGAMLAAGGGNAQTKAPESPLTAQVEDPVLEQVQAPEAKKPAGEAEKGKPVTCTGQITDQTTGKPVAGATVSVEWLIIMNTGKGLQFTHEITDHVTDAAGKYSFIVPPEKANQQFRVHVTHPDFVGKAIFKYYASGLVSIPKGPMNAKLDPGEAITGIVLTPDGEPAAGVKVVASSRAGSISQKPGEKLDQLNLFGSQTSTRTDANGRFRLKTAAPGPAIFWIVPEKYAASEHRLTDKERGDRGKFKLAPGLTLQGKLLDVKGKPLAGVTVGAGKMYESPNDFTGVLSLMGGFPGRSDVTNKKGEFTIKALAPGLYFVAPGSMTQAAPDFFVRREVTLREWVKPEVLEIRAVPYVVITLQAIDSTGKPIRGTIPVTQINGEFEKTYCDTAFQPDPTGKLTAKVPHGLENAKLISPQVQGIRFGGDPGYRYRLKKGDPLKELRQATALGTVIDNLTIEIVIPEPWKGEEKKKDK
jgi:RNA polymerase sigma factor (sigma-70 family)